jgi:hypothetical protein
MDELPRNPGTMFWVDWMPRIRTVTLCDPDVGTMTWPNIWARDVNVRFNRKHMTHNS